MGINKVKRRAVFLDRDGIVNQSVVRDGKPYPPATVEETRLTEGIAAALSILKERGFLLVVVTNQPDVARKTVARGQVEAIHKRLQSQLPLDAVYACFHDDSDNCLCRKPKPGMLLEAALEMDIDLEASFMVGDRWRDIDAGTAAGCRTVFVDYGYRETLRTSPDWTITTPAHMTDVIR